MAEPVTLAEAKRHLDVVRDDQDELIASQITAAREWVESHTGLSFDGDAVTQTFRCFFHTMPLLIWPERDDVAVRVDYLSQLGEPVRIEGARVWRAAKPARLRPPAGAAWPDDADGVIAVTVPGVPFSLKVAMLLMIADLYNQREETAVGVSIAPTGAVLKLCWPYRMERV